MQKEKPSGRPLFLHTCDEEVVDEIRAIARRQLRSTTSQMRIALREWVELQRQKAAA